MQYESELSLNCLEAILLIENGEPLPTYLTADLLQEGIDVSELENKYGK